MVGFFPDTDNSVDQKEMDRLEQECIRMFRVHTKRQPPYQLTGFYMNGQVVSPYVRNWLQIIGGDHKVEPPTSFEMTRFPVDTEEEAKARFDRFVREFDTE